MTAGFYWFIVGGVTMTFVSTIFFSVKYHEIYEKSQSQKVALFHHAQTITDLESRLSPVKWDDAPAYEELRDRIPELLEPGTEIIKIDSQGDMPDVDAWAPTDHPLDAELLRDWRNKVGD